MISSVRNALPDMSGVAKGGKPSILRTYLYSCPTPLYTYLSLYLPVSCAYENLAQFQSSVPKASTNFHIKITTTSGEMMNEARWEQHLDVVSPRLSPLYPKRLWKCRKPARGLESWLVSDFQSTQDWRLKSNLIKCIAGILQK